MTQETWNAARLIPTSGITGADEQERRATSALLAVMASVREFGRALTQPLGAPVGTLTTYIEVPFELGERKVFPDGLIRLTRGKRSWTALVEVKTGSNELRTEQIEDYLDVARANGYDLVLTISNQIEPQPGVHPVKANWRKTKKVALAHLSWTQVLTTAVMEKQHRGISDPDQAWILGELIRYLEHPRSGAMEFEDMGESWVPVRTAVETGTLRAGDKGTAEVASRWDQLIRYACLRLGRDLGVEVHPVLSRKEQGDPSLRSQAVIGGLADRGILTGQIRIPDTAGPVTLTADLRAQQVSVAIDIDAPREGRPQTRVNWLLRQLKDAPGSVRVDAFALNARGASTSELLASARENPLLLIGDTRKELRSFRVVASAPMGGKRGQGRGSFIGSVIGLLDSFYGTTIQNLKPWSATPPRLRPNADEARQEAAEQVEAEGIRPADVSTAPSSQDGPNLSRAVTPTSIPTPISPPTDGTVPEAPPRPSPAVGDERGDEVEEEVFAVPEGNRTDGEGAGLPLLGPGGFASAEPGAPPL